MSSLSAVRKALSHRSQLAMVGSLVAGIAIVVGCGSDDDSAPGPGSAGAAGKTSASAGHAGTANPSGGSPAGGNATGGNSAGGNATSGNSAGGNANGGAATAGSSGQPGAGGGTAGNGTGGTSGNGGNGGTGGVGVMCPAEAGAAGEGGANDSGLDPTGDDDRDDVPNCLDHCPLDRAKTEPGVCGCGAFDDDDDKDGTLNCKDACPEDPLKTALGVCGCGISDANTDGDAQLDCKDACPKDPLLTEATACGCLPASLGAMCLAHRYKFEGTGAVAADSIDTVKGVGTVVGAQLSGTGTVVLAGGATDQYVKLPAGLISALGDNATFETWVTWPGTGGNWQRIFDFGTSTAGADAQGTAAGTLFLTPRPDGNGLRTAISGSDYRQEDVAGIATPLPTSVLTQVVVVVKGASLSLYLNGVVQGAGATIRPTVRLALLNDTNNWLGRSQYQGDESLTGTLHEFRIYSRALTAAEIQADFTAGPDTLAP